MKLRAETADAAHEIEIDRDGGTVKASVDGREYELEFSRPEPNVYLLRDGTRIFEAGVNASADGVTSVRIGADDFEFAITDPKKLRGSGAADGTGDGAAEIKTAMPGKVVRILAEAGTEVEKGTGVLIVEAMKMQNELKSPRPGVVKEIRVTEGETVNAGSVLAVIE